MSDNIKLVIEISKVDYENIKQYYESHDIVETTYSYIYHGIPLDNVKAEIENIPNDDTTKPIGTYDYCMGAENERKLILSIIDKYIGGKE